MRIIETQAQISEDHQLNIQLPDDIQAGHYQVAIIINPQPESQSHFLNQFAGKVQAFKNIDPVAWQRQIRDEWDEDRLPL
jgi:hypothetical protein